MQDFPPPGGSPSAACHSAEGSPFSQPGSMPQGRRTLGLITSLRSCHSRQSGCRETTEGHGGRKRRGNLLSTCPTNPPRGSVLYLRVVDRPTGNQEPVKDNKQAPLIPPREGSGEATGPPRPFMSCGAPLEGNMFF